jgi:itaconate CoA-transferase
VRDRWVDTESPVGTVRTLAPPWLPADSHTSLGGVPDVGAHTESVLRWLGLPAEDLDRLRRQEII